MKFIHLSDLHIGKRVNELSMIEEQEYILTQILQIIDDETPDAVIIAGDVYDKSVPTTEAVELLDSFLFRLSKRDTDAYCARVPRRGCKAYRQGRAYLSAAVHQARACPPVLRE